VTHRLNGSTLSLLYLLVANAGRVLTREEIQDALWRSDRMPTSNSVDRMILQLRRRLQDDAARPRLIQTLLGRGYRFVPADA
jgi:two-component system response regulator RstA